MKNYFIPPSGFYIGDFEIRFYGVIMSLSMLVGVIISCWLGKKKKISSDDIFLLALFVLPCSVIGARLYFCLFYEYNYSFKELFNIRQGGLAIYGGVIGGVIGILIYALVKKDFKKVVVLFDVCVAGLILGQSIGRWGNFFNQEAYGNLITNKSFCWFPFAVFIEDKNAWYQATFFYESLWNFVGFFLILAVFFRAKQTGTTTAVYLIWYGLGRTIIEGFRSDSLYLANTTIRISQLLSFILILLGLSVLIANIYKERKRQSGQT